MVCCVHHHREFCGLILYYWTPWHVWIYDSKQTAAHYKRLHLHIYIIYIYIYVYLYINVCMNIWFKTYSCILRETIYVKRYSSQKTLHVQTYSRQTTHFKAYSCILRETICIYILCIYIYKCMHEFMIQNVQLPTDRLYVSTHTADRQHKTYSCILWQTIDSTN